MTDADRLVTPMLAAEFDRIRMEGERRGLTLRAFVGVAFYLHVGNHDLFARLGRDPVNDLDLVGLSEERKKYKKLFKELDYEIDWDLLVAGEGKRFMFKHAGDPPVEVDLFIDRLDMCHRIELRDRLALQPRTIPLADLLLQKLQIVDLNRKAAVVDHGLQAHPRPSPPASACRRSHARPPATAHADTPQSWRAWRDRAATR